MSIGALEHVLVLADDIDGTREFYCQVVGLSVGGRPPLAFPGYWLYAEPDGSGAACLHVADRSAYAAHAAELGLNVPSGPDPGVGPVDHIAFSASDYDALLERLERQGVRPVTNAVPGGPRQVFIQDPNGVRVEINVSDPEDEAR
jgi:catechol 2,3-dioxygenase-like lactoylglutathione lyase family enzyme